MMVPQGVMVQLGNEVIVETLGLQVCQALQVPLGLLARWAHQEMRDKEGIRVLEVL